MKLWSTVKELFKKKKKPRPTTQVFKVLPKPAFEKRVVEKEPTPLLDEAVVENKDACHIDFNKVRKITRKFNRRNKKITEFYDDGGDLITD